MTVLHRLDPNVKPRGRKAKPVAAVEPGPIDIPTATKPPQVRREPRPHFPHLVRPRPGCFVLPVDAV